MPLVVVVDFGVGQTQFRACRHGVEDTHVPCVGRGFVPVTRARNCRKLQGRPRPCRRSGSPRDRRILILPDTIQASRSILTLLATSLLSSHCEPSALVSCSLTVILCSPIATAACASHVQASSSLRLHRCFRSCMRPAVLRLGRFSACVLPHVPCAPVGSVSAAFRSMVPVPQALPRIRALAIIALTPCFVQSIYGCSHLQ